MTAASVWWSWEQCLLVDLGAGDWLCNGDEEDDCHGGIKKVFDRKHNITNFRAKYHILLQLVYPLLWVKGPLPYSGEG